MNTMTHSFDTLTLQTERLVLRPPVGADYTAYAASSLRDRPPRGLSPNHGFRDFATNLGHWQIRGYGLWAICERGCDTAIGLAGPFYLPAWDEREIGWHVFEGFEGKSIAYEAVQAVRLDTYQRLGWDGAVSYIPPENTRSIKLAERLGAFHDKKTTASHDPDCLVYRHPTLKELS